jgi:hypothetical protein
MVPEEQLDSKAGALVEPVLEEEDRLLREVMAALDQGSVAQARNLLQLHVEQQRKHATAIGDYDAVRDSAFSNLPLDDRFMALLQGTRTMLDVDVAALLLVDDEDSQLWPRASSGFASPVNRGGASGKTTKAWIVSTVRAPMA